VIIHSTGPIVNTGEAGQWVLFFLTGSGALGIFTIVRAFLAVRNNVETREGKAIANLEQWRVDADVRAENAEARCSALSTQLDVEREWGRYWQIRSARAERALTLAGLELPTPPARPARANE
jgi:hypothetical protein